MSFKYGYKDLCHKPISKSLSECGCAVFDLSKLGNGAPDCLCIRGNIIRLFEFKSDKGKFRKSQLKWQNDNPRMAQYYRKITTFEMAAKEMELI